MHKLTKRVPTGARVAVVEIRSGVPVHAALKGFDPRAIQLMAGTFQEAGVKWNQVATYSLLSTGTVSQSVASTELSTALAARDLSIVVAVGAEATKLLCGTKKPLDKYAGSLTWSEEFGVWVLPTHHPSCIYVGPRETMNARYDKFDNIYAQIFKAVRLVTGEDSFPPKTGLEVPQEWIGHDGIQLEDKTWSGYDECTDEEAERAVEVLSGWLAELDT